MIKFFRGTKKRAKTKLIARADTWIVLGRVFTKSLEISVGTGDNGQVNIFIEPEEGNDTFHLAIGPEDFERIAEVYRSKVKKLQDKQTIKPFKQRYHEVSFVKNQNNKIYHVVKVFKDGQGNTMRIRELDDKYLVQRRLVSENIFTSKGLFLTLDRAINAIESINEEG